MDLEIAKDFAIMFAISAFMVWLVCFFIKYAAKKHPTKIKECDEGFIISAWVVSKAGGYYDDFVFTKRKNGKYKMKLPIIHGVVMGVLAIFVIPLMTGLIITFLKQGVKNPDYTLPYQILCLFMIFIIVCLFAMLGSGMIRAELFFRKYMKENNADVKTTTPDNKEL